LCGASLRALSLIASLWLSSPLLGWHIYLNWLIKFLLFHLWRRRLLSLIGELIVNIVLLALDILVFRGCSHLVSRYQAPLFWLNISQIAWQSFCQVLLMLFLFVHVLINPTFCALCCRRGIFCSSWPFLRFWGSNVHYNFIMVLHLSYWDVVGRVYGIGVLIISLLKIIHLRLWVISKR
jgi:hypothetical protein